MKFIIKLISVSLVLTSTLFAQDVATLTAIKGSVTIEDAQKSKEATLGMKLHEKESVLTADKSKAQLIFEDETVVTVGKNSHFSIQEYLYDDSQKPNLEFGLFKGAISTISGKIGKIAPEKFIVKTKTATIGIRGTNFTVVVLKDESQKAYCTYGAISVEFGKKSYIVEHGYYLNISRESEASLQAFSADELVRMRDENFGKSQALDGTLQEGSSVRKESMLDTTRRYAPTPVAEELSESVQDAIQIESVEDEIHHEQYIDYHDDYQYDYPVPSEPLKTLQTGWSVDNDYDTSMTSRASLEIAEDGSSLTSENSWVEVFNKANATGEYDNWTLYLSNTPTTYTNKNDFSVNFSAGLLTPIGSSSSTNARITGGSLSATADLDPDDRMSWGIWDIAIDFESMQSGETTQDSHDFQGMWVTGEPTDASVIAALSGIREYEGKYQAFEIYGDFRVQEGIANLEVDFTADSAHLTIFGNSATGGTIATNYQYNDMSINGNSISGGAASANEGSANGTFYGTDGKSVGGNFQILDGSMGGVKGVYQVTAP